MTDPFAQEGGLPSVSFGGRDSNNQITTKPVGYKIKLLVTKAPTLVQSRQYGGTALLFWDPNKKGQKTTEANDQPCMSVVLHGKVVADSEGSDIGVEKAVWAQKPSNLFIEIGNAKKVALGDRGIDIGDTIEIELVGFKQGEDKTKAAAKQYKVTIAASDAFSSPAAPVAAPAGPTGPAAPPAAPAGPPPPTAAPVLVDGYDKAAYIATGWTEEAMKGEAKFAPFFAAAPAPAGPAAPAAPAAPAGPAAPVEDPAAKRAAALAAMSPEDKALLGLT